MARSPVQITFDLPSLGAKYKREIKNLYLFVAAQIQTNRGMLFDKEGAHNGHPKWPGLKFRQGQILSKRGTLRKSMSPIPARGLPGNDGIVRISSESIVVGTHLFYARMMNDGTRKMPGGVLKPVRAKALRIPLPAGKSATTLAQTLGKTAKSGKSYFQKVTELRQEIESAKQPARRAKLRERLTQMEQKAKTMKGPEKYIFRKSVKIPPRPFDQWNEEDEKELGEAVTNKIMKILNG